MVAILAVLGVGASLSALRGGAPGAGAEADMSRFRAAWTNEADLAVAGQARRGLEVSPEGLRRAVHDAGGWTLAETVEPLRRQAVLNAEPGPPGAPDIVFLANGRSTPFEIVFPGGSRPSGRCVSDGWTGLTCGY